MTKNRSKLVIISAGMGAFQRIAQILGTLITMPLVLSAIGQREFGIWSAANSISWFICLADFGLSTSLIMLVGRSVGIEQINHAQVYFRQSLKLGSIFALSLLILALLVISSVSSNEQANSYTIAILGLALSVPFGIANSMWTALQKTYIASFWELIQTIIMIGGIFLLVFVTKSTNALPFVILFAAAPVIGNIGSFVHFYIVHPKLRPETNVKHHVISLPKLVNLSFPFFIFGLVTAMSTYADNIIALETLGPNASAEMAIALRLCVTALGLLGIVSQPLLPAFTDALARNEFHWITKKLMQGTILLFCIAGAGALFLIVFGKKMLELWLRTDLSLPDNLYWAMAAWIIGVSLPRVPSLLLSAEWVIRPQLILAVIFGFISFGLKFSLTPYLGVSGILWATALANLLIITPGYVFLIYQRSKTHSQAKGKLL